MNEYRSFVRLSGLFGGFGLSCTDLLGRSSYKRGSEWNRVLASLPKISDSPRSSFGTVSDEGLGFQGLRGWRLEAFEDPEPFTLRP